MQRLKCLRYSSTPPHVFMAWYLLKHWSKISVIYITLTIFWSWSEVLLSISASS